MLKGFQPVRWIGPIALAALAAWPACADERPVERPARPGPAFPLKVAEGGRYLVDQRGTPFLIAGESPQALMVNLSDQDAVELNYEVSGSRDDQRWASVIDVSAAYTYYPTYAEVLKEYNRRPAQPVVLIEADYEFERASTPAVLRRQEYWALLSGAAGQLYGNAYTWPFKAGWQDKLDTPGAKQMAHVQALFGPRAWHQLVPDQKHAVVTAGYGTFDATTTAGNRFVMTSDYVTAARTPNGALVLAYLPSRRTVTVDMKQLGGPATARWYDSSRGTYTAVAGSPLPNAGARAITPPGNNGDGDGDWVLVLETAPPEAERRSADVKPDQQSTPRSAALVGRPSSLDG
jgi:hypothetical protein